jgi:hypothetical protein
MNVLTSYNDGLLRDSGFDFFDAAADMYEKPISGAAGMFIHVFPNAAKCGITHVSGRGIERLSFEEGLGRLESSLADSTSRLLADLVELGAINYEERA